MKEELEKATPEQITKMIQTAGNVEEQAKVFAEIVDNKVFWLPKPGIKGLVKGHFTDERTATVDLWRDVTELWTMEVTWNGLFLKVHLGRRSEQSAKDTAQELLEQLGWTEL